MTPEQVRDETIARIIQAGGVVAGYTALARPDDPSVVVAHRIHAGAPDPETAEALAVIRGETETDLTGLIPAVMEVEVYPNEGDSI